MRPLYQWSLAPCLFLFLVACSHTVKKPIPNTPWRIVPSLESDPSDLLSFKDREGNLLKIRRLAKGLTREQALTRMAEKSRASPKETEHEISLDKGIASPAPKIASQMILLYCKSERQLWEIQFYIQDGWSIPPLDCSGLPVSL